MPNSRLADLECRMTVQYKLEMIPIILSHYNYILSAKVRFYSANIGLLPCAPVTWWWIWWDKKMNPLQVIGLQRIGVGGLAERQVLETIIKYIIIMMLHFVLYILIYSILSSI